jgi:hypothetical protein
MAKTVAPVQWKEVKNEAVQCADAGQVQGHQYADGEDDRMRVLLADAQPGVSPFMRQAASSSARGMNSSLI